MDVVLVLLIVLSGLAVEVGDYALNWGGGSVGLSECELVNRQGCLSLSLSYWLLGHTHVVFLPEFLRLLGVGCLSCAHFVQLLEVFFSLTGFALLVVSP